MDAPVDAVDSRKCSLCGSTSNVPHPMDEYHLLLQELKFTVEHITNAQSIAGTKAPSIKNDLDAVVKSIAELYSLARRM